MRNLTIKRTKSFVASAMKMKVYIEDPSFPEIVINDTPCRKLGTVKNGEEKTFAIDERASRVFVIADKLSKNYCNEYYNIPAGEEDVFLTGKNHFNPASGNAFRFDGVTDPEILQNRKKGSKKGLLVLIIAVIVGFLIGYSLTAGWFSTTKVEEKTFSSNGLQITLTDQFSETNAQNFTFCYESKDAIVFALREGFDLLDGFENYTIEQYGELVLKNNNLSSDIQLENSDGLTYFQYSYTVPTINENYHYFTVLYKAPDAFWMVQFATLDKNFEQQQQTIIDWAKSVEFSK
ncbi:MAG: hypothetical protein J1E05_02810 [Eubacterium sp.]|nr:hypothetical protein [Eubacterium sp.]